MMLVGKQYRRKKQRAFTLVETLVSITLLLMAIIGPMTIAAQGLQSGFFANDRTTAVYLAQEALESIEKLRDENIIASRETPADTWSWYDSPSVSGFDDCKSSNGCDYEVDSGEYHDCTYPTDCVLKLHDPDVYGYRYGYEGINDSRYTRVITLNDYEESDRVEVTVAVSWEAALFGGKKDVTLTTWLYDYANRYDN